MCNNSGTEKSRREFTFSLFVGFQNTGFSIYQFSFWRGKKKKSVEKLFY